MFCCVFTFFYLLKELFRRLWVHFIGWSFPSLVWPCLLFPLCWLRLVIQHAHTSWSLEKEENNNKKCQYGVILWRTFTSSSRDITWNTHQQRENHIWPKDVYLFSISVIYYVQLLKFPSCWTKCFCPTNIFFLLQYLLFQTPIL